MVLIFALVLYHAVPAPKTLFRTPTSVSHLSSHVVLAGTFDLVYGNCRPSPHDSPSWYTQARTTFYSTVVSHWGGLV